MLSLTTGKRMIAGGEEFDVFFPDHAQHSDPIILRNGTVENSVEKMAEISTKFQADTKLLSAYLKGKSTYETAKNIWHFIYRYIQYTEDEEGIEQIRRPLRSWLDRKEGVDCDCMGVFASSILKNLGIPHYFRITKYSKPEFQHVYVIIPAEDLRHAPDGYYIIDGVIDSFNKEKSFHEHKDFNPMSGFPIQLLNGFAGEAVDQAFLYDYLMAMKRQADLDPAMVAQIAPCEANDFLTYILSHWQNEHDRAEAIRSVATLEENQYPHCNFFRTLFAVQCGEATMKDLIKTNFITMDGLGDVPIWEGYGWNPTSTTPASTGGFQWGSLFSFLSDSLNIVSNWGQNTNQSTPNPYINPNPNPTPVVITTPDTKDNTLMYVIIGGIALMGGIMIAKSGKS